MRKDPFAALSGLDQQLFQQGSRDASKKQRDNETTLARTNVLTSERLNEETLLRGNDSTDQRLKETTDQRANEATRPRVAPLRGQIGPARVKERHSHDIFQDQVRWLNRAKLDVEERYGRRVTVNGLVQLALDLMRKDHEVNKSRSNVVRVLVRGESARLPSSDESSE